MSNPLGEVTRSPELDLSEASVFRNSKRKKGSNSKEHNELVKAILQVCAAYHFFAWPTKVGGGFLPMAGGKTGFFKFGVKGMADVLCLIPVAKFKLVRTVKPRSFGDKVFVPLWIESKTGSGDQDEFQKSFQVDVTERGHQYLLCRQTPELVAFLTEIVDGIIDHHLAG